MTWEYEEKAWASGYGAVCGVDEAGRGPVAGPVCAAAVILPAGIVIEGLHDSKKLSEKKREKLFDEITENALAWSVSGDAKIPSVAAASIIAKVTRDRLMRQFAEQYPQYGFEKHKGYETRAHDEALLAHGPCPIHRMTFLKKFYEKHPEAPR